MWTVESHTKEMQANFRLENKTANKNGIVFLGDSITEHFDTKHYYPNEDTFNRGISGDTGHGILKRLKEAIYDLNPRKVFLMIGTNDLCNGDSNEVIINNIKTIIKHIKDYNSNIQIYLESIYPIHMKKHPKINEEYIVCRSNKRIQEINKVLNQIPNITFINLYKELCDIDGDIELDYTTEGLHITQEGYDVISKILRPYIKEDLQTEKRNTMDMIKGGLVVSCQALEDEPLHSSFIMSKMALAAVQGGAIGIRANTVEDIIAIRKEVNVPIIGIIKACYENSDVYITPTMKEVKELIDAKVDIIAIDATSSPRPDGLTIDELVNNIKTMYPNQLLMADCSTKEEAIHAAKIGFDFVGTTLVGYTKQSKDTKIHNNDFELIREIMGEIDVPVIAEGNIDTPEKYKRLIELGVHCVVVGSIITRPQYITERFTK